MSRLEFIQWLEQQPQTRERYFRKAHKIRPAVAVADMKVLADAFGDHGAFHEAFDRAVAVRCFGAVWDAKHLRIHVFFNEDEVRNGE